MKQVMIAGATSGVGKTSITLGLLEVLRRRGLKVKPYKVGPDYIDTSFHKHIFGEPSINIDQFLIPDKKVLKALYMRSLLSHDIAVVEGVMGLYDGLGVDKSYCSSAGISKQLDIPVVLVIDGKSTSTSAAAIVKGFVELDRQVNIVGVIINRVGSETHFMLIKKAIEYYTDIPVIGYLKKNDTFSLPSRHLGLVTDGEISDVMKKIEGIADSIEKTINIELLLEVSGEVKLTKNIYKNIENTLSQYEKSTDAQGLTVAYALDKAFSFYYQDNLNLLKNIGMDTVSFSPLNDKKLPDADIYYFGGGFPELFAKELSQNIVMREQILSAHNKGKVIYAECGGLMYLGDSIVVEKIKYDMVGIFEGYSYMTDRLKRFGYCKYVNKQPDTIFDCGIEISGHEFHHSDFQTSMKPAGKIYKERDGLIVKEWLGGYSNQNTFASYLHIHFYQNPDILKNIINKIKR